MHPTRRGRRHGPTYYHRSLAVSYFCEPNLLSESIKQNDWHTLRTLLSEQRVDPDWACRDNTPALILAVWANSRISIDALLKWGADLWAEDVMGKSAIIHAIQGNKPTLEMLLKAAQNPPQTYLWFLHASFAPNINDNLKRRIVELLWSGFRQHMNTRLQEHPRCMRYVNTQTTCALLDRYMQLELYTLSDEYPVWREYVERNYHHWMP
jgi:hypothetical protein